MLATCTQNFKSLAAERALNGKKRSFCVFFNFKAAHTHIALPSGWQIFYLSTVKGTFCPKTAFLGQNGIFTLFQGLYFCYLIFYGHGVSCIKMRHACSIIEAIWRSWSTAHGGNLGNSYWENQDSQATKALIKNLALDALHICISYTLTKF